MIEKELYKLRIYNPVGILQAEVTDFSKLVYLKTVNEPGLLQFVLDGSHPAIAYLVNNAQVEVWRKTDRLDWYCDFYAFLKDENFIYQRGLDKYTAKCPGQLSKLAGRIVAWFAETANRSRFTGIKAETVAKTLVLYNAGTAATTANGRIRAGVMPGIGIQADSVSGNTLDSFSCAWENLLTSLQKIALRGGGDFDLVKTGAVSWEFRWYAGQRGTDRSGSLVFSLDRANLSDPSLDTVRSSEKTVAIVGGDGEESARAITIVTGPNFSADNDIELFVDARNEVSTALPGVGAEKLEAAKAAMIFDFDIIQTPSCAYGADYALGDLVTVKHKGITQVVKIQSVQVTFSTVSGAAIDVRVTNA